MISFQQIQYIISVYKEGSFNKAAEKCFVTQPTLSMQIKKAEEILEMEIFDRNHQPISLTEKGKELLPRLLDLEQSYTGVNDWVKKLKGEYKERLVIGVIPTMALYLIPDMYGAWKMELGKVILEIKEMTTTDLIQALKDHVIDMAIFAGPFEHASFEVIRIGKEEIVGFSDQFVGSKTISLAQLQTLKPWVLSKGNCLRTQMLHWCNWTENQWSSDAMQNEEWKYEGGNLLILMQMVTQYGGYTLIPENLVLTNKEKKKSFHILDEDGQRPAREWIAVFPSNSSKRNIILDLLKPIQQKYFKNKNNNFKTLDWK